MMESVPSAAPATAKKRKQSTSQVATAESRTLQQSEDNFLSAFQETVNLVETIGKTMDRFEAVVKKHIRKDHLDKWNELASAHIKLRKQTYLLAATLKGRVEELEPSVKGATTVDDLKDIISFVTDKQMRNRLNAFGDGCIEITALLRQFDRILREHYSPVGWYKESAVAIGLLLYGLALLGVAQRVSTSTLGNGTSMLVLGGASATGFVCSASYFNVLKMKQELKELKDWLGKDFEATLEMGNYLTRLQVSFGEGPLFFDCITSRSMLELIKRDLYNRFQKISRICEKLVWIVTSPIEINSPKNLKFEKLEKKNDRSMI